MKVAVCCLLVALLVSLLPAVAQTPGGGTAVTSASTEVPKLVRFSGTATDEAGKPISGVVGVTFSLYKDEQGGAPLWIETQNIKADATGHYTALLGSASADGVPLELFSSGDAQWLGVQIHGQPQRARVLLVSVPYALKAHEAETLSGRSISDFVLLSNTKSQSTGAASSQPNSNGARSSSSPAVTTNGPTNFVGSTTNQVVGVSQTGTGTGLSATATTHAAVAGTITGTSNTAVFGLASNTSAGSTAAGVTGQANTQLGPGVQGVTTSAKGVGVQGVVNSSSGGTAVQGLNKATSGFSSGVSGQTSSVGTNSSGVNGFEAATTGQVYGVVGGTNSTTRGAAAVNGYEGAKTGQVYGVTGSTPSTSGTGVAGFATGTSGPAIGVYGQSASASGNGVTGNATATSGNTAGVYGQSASPNGNGVSGLNIATTGSTNGVYGQANSTSGIGVQGNATATSGATVGVQAAVSSSSGVAGLFSNVSGAGLILKGLSGSSYRQVFSVDASGNGVYAGNLNVTGKLTKGSGSFKIDHPLDPANKYLSHSFVESPDMMNVYNGNVTTDKHGLATVVLPDYFEALNVDFRYQLTVIGQFAQAIVKHEIENNRFTIKTNKPSVRVSWQVTGIRHDAYANAYRIPAEEDKPVAERGYYLHPEVFGQPASKSIQAAGQASTTDQLAKVSNP